MTEGYLNRDFVLVKCGRQRCVPAIVFSRQLRQEKITRPWPIKDRGVWVTEAGKLPATAAAATSAALAWLPFLRFVHAQRTTAHILAVKLLDGFLSRTLIHLHESEAAWAASLAVSDQFHRMYGAERLELCTHFLFGSGKGQITYID